MENNERMHHGILGMKWGVRRYQNKDGTLTEEGKLRYGKVNLTRIQDKSEIKMLCKMGLVDEGGYLTRKGHQFEVDRRSKLSAEESEKELRELVIPWTCDLDDDEDKAVWMPSIIVRSEVDNFICDPYNPEYTVSKTLQKLQDEIFDLRDKIDYPPKDHPWSKSEKDKLYDQFFEKYDELASGILQRLGYADTKKTRAYIKPIAIHFYWFDSYESIEDLEKALVHSDATSYALAHHGIKGQKWGIRRFRNADGSLTVLGRSRYGVGEKQGSGEKGGGSKASGVPGTGQNKGDAKSQTRASTNVHTLSDEELRKRISRLDMEKRYSDLVAEQKKRETSIAARLLKEASTEFLKQSFSKIATKTANRLFGDDEDRFEISKYRDADTSKMDLGTLKKMKKWYETAGDIANKRDSYDHRGAPSGNEDLSKLSTESLSSVKKWFETARATENAKESYERRNEKKDKKD